MKRVLLSPLEGLLLSLRLREEVGHSGSLRKDVCTVNHTKKPVGDWTRKDDEVTQVTTRVTVDSHCKTHKG